MKNVMSPPTCIVIPLHTKVTIKIADPTSVPSHCSMPLGYDHRILSFIDDKANECFRDVSDKEEGIEDDMVTKPLCMVPHYIECAHYLYFHLCPKTFVFTMHAIN